MMTQIVPLISSSDLGLKAIKSTAGDLISSATGKSFSGMVTQTGAGVSIVAPQANKPQPQSESTPAATPLDVTQGEADEILELIAALPGLEEAKKTLQAELGKLNSTDLAELKNKISKMLTQFEAAGTETLQASLEAGVPVLNSELAAPLQAVLQSFDAEHGTNLMDAASQFSQVISTISPEISEKIFPASKAAVGKAPAQPATLQVAVQLLSDMASVQPQVGSQNAGNRSDHPLQSFIAQALAVSSSPEATNTPQSMQQTTKLVAEPPVALFARDALGNMKATPSFQAALQTLSLVGQAGSGQSTSATPAGIPAGTPDISKQITEAFTQVLKQPAPETVGLNQMSQASQPQSSPVAEAARAEDPGKQGAASSRLASLVSHQINSSQMSHGKTTIELAPRGLGNLEITIENDRNGQMRAVIKADNPQVLEMMRHERGHLSTLLGDKGFDFDQSNLEFESFEKGGNQKQEQEGSSDFAVSDLVEDDEETTQTISSDELDILT